MVCAIMFLSGSVRPREPNAEEEDQVDEEEDRIEDPVLDMIFRYPPDIQARGEREVEHYVRFLCSQYAPDVTFPNPFNCRMTWRCAPYGELATTYTCKTGEGVRWPSGSCVPVEESHCYLYPIPPTNGL